MPSKREKGFLGRVVGSPLATQYGSPKRHGDTDSVSGTARPSLPRHVVEREPQGEARSYAPPGRSSCTVSASRAIRCQPYSMGIVSWAS